MARTACRLLLASCLLLLVSCTFPGSVRPTIKLGLVAPFEGRYRAVGYDVIYAARLALREVNQAGGVNGYAVELVAYDDGARAAMAVEQARKLDVDPDVLGVIGHFQEETTRAASGTYAQAGLALVAPGMLDAQFTRESEGLYRLGPPASVLAGALLDRATELVRAGPERRASDGTVLLVGQGRPLGAALEDLAPEWEAANPNWRFARVAADTADWRSDVLTCDPAVILCDLDPVRAGEVVAELRQQGWSGDVLGGPALAASDFAAVAGRSAQGAEFVTPWPFLRDVPGGDVFAAAYRGVSDGVEPGILAIPAYEAMWILVEALEQVAGVEEPTRRAVSAALARVERAGMLGSLVFDEGNGWSGDTLYWYRIGPDGASSLVERVSWPARASRTRPPRSGEGG